MGTSSLCATRAGSVEILNAGALKATGKMGAGQGQTESQAAALVLLVRRYPDTLERLEKVAAG